MSQCRCEWSTDVFAEGNSQLPRLATIDTDLWRHYWFGMVNRGVMAQPYWWDEQWTISVQHTEADIESILRRSKTSRPRWRQHSRNAWQSQHTSQ